MSWCVDGDEFPPRSGSTSSCPTARGRHAGREFLDLARELLASGTLPRHWRAIIIHAYYALLLECRDAMTRWGLPPLTRQLVHAQVRLRLVFATERDLKEIGYRLEELGGTVILPVTTSGHCRCLSRRGAQAAVKKAADASPYSMRSMRTPHGVAAAVAAIKP